MPIKYQVGIKLGNIYPGTPTIIRTNKGMCCEVCPTERDVLLFVLIRAL